MKKLMLALVLFLFGAHAHGETLLIYSTLRSSPRAKTIGYLNQVQKVLKDGGDHRLSSALLIDDQNSSCVRQKMLTCHPGLYGFNRCVKNPQAAHLSCYRPLTAGMLDRYYGEPEFHRASWTSMLIKLSTLCDKKFTKPCQQLLALKSQFLKTK